MKYTIALIAAFFIASTVAQWPCQANWNGAISNCASCNVLGSVWSNDIGSFSVCTNCTAGFFLNQSACLPCTANCSSCQQNGACISGGCNAGYAFVQTNSTCVACPSSLNCQQCAYNWQSGTNFKNGPFYCSSCMSNNYYISSTTGGCVACPSNCGDGSGNPITSSSVFTGSGACPSGTCTQCQSGYFLSSGNCTACIAGCQTCSASTTCTTCYNGYFGAGGPPLTSCTACNGTVANCISCASASTCNTISGSCASGYYPASATNCTSCGSNCQTCSSTTACSTCSTGYYLANSSSTTCTACGTNCTACNSYSGSTAGGSCTQCGVNTTLVNGVCLACPANCTACSPVSSTSTSTVCLQCQLGFGLSDMTGLCVQCPANCDYCDGSGVCTQCRSGAYSSSQVPVVVGQGSSLKSGAVIPVPLGYFLPPNQCQQCPYNCSSCANSTFCYNNCTKNYVFNSTTNQCLPNGIGRVALTGFALLSVLFYFL